MLVAAPPTSAGSVSRARDGRGPEEPSSSDLRGSIRALMGPTTQASAAAGTASREEGILTATRGVHAPPELRPGSGRPQRRFVLVLLAAAVGIVLLVGALNALIDPYGSLGTGLVTPAVWTDRAEKVRLADDLTTPPRVIVLGSSRAMKVEPSYITRRLGLPAFNAAVSSGRPADASVLAAYLHDRFPGTPQSYLWLLDQEAFADDTVDPSLLADRRLAGYLPVTVRWESRVHDFSWLLSWRTLRLSWQTLRTGNHAPRDGRVPEAGPHSLFAPDGFRRFDLNDRRAAKGRSLKAGLRASLNIFRRRYRDAFTRLEPLQRRLFERTLTAMNDRGATPVIVLTPMQPRLRRALLAYGWERHHAQVVAYLHSLQPRLRFVVLDFSDLSAFGGSPRAFYDGVHMTVANYRRLVDAVLADPAAAAALRGSR